MIFTIGELFYYIYQYHQKSYKKLGSSPFHFVYHQKSLGQPVTFVSRIGKDGDGYRIQNLLRQNNISNDAIQIDDKYSTGAVYLSEKSEINYEYGYDLLQEAADAFISYNNEVDSALNNNVKLIYFTTLSQRSISSYYTITKIMKNKNPKTKCLCDINHKSYFYSDIVIKNSLHHSNAVRIDKDSLDNTKEIFGTCDSDESFIRDLIIKFSLDWILFKKSEVESDLYISDNPHPFNAKQKTRNTPIIADTFGVNDAFLSIIAFGYLQAWGPEKSVERARIFADEICRVKGAIPFKESIYKEYRRKWEIY